MPNSEESCHSSHKAVTQQVDAEAWTNKPYPAYKDSGVEWLGKVPQSWTMARLKGVVANITNLTKELDVGNIYLALEHVESWTGRYSIMNNHIHFDSQAKRFQSGDILFGKLRPYLAKVICPARDGVCSGEFLVLRPRHVGLLSKYLEQLLRSKPVILIIDASTFGAKMPRADWQFIGDMKIPLPPLAEQRAIARFLDHANQRIQRYIEAKEKLVKLLEEQKQVIIQQTVTGQVDVRTGQPYPAYKDSGVEWLGEVPEHWEVRRLRRFIRITVGFPFKSEGFTQADGDIRLLRGVNIVPGGLRWHEVVRWPAGDIGNFVEYQMQTGDIVIGMDRPIIRSGTRVAVVSSSDIPSLLLQRVARIRVRDGLVHDFAVAFLSGKGFADYLAPIFTGISVPHLSSDQINNFQFAVPSVSEQQSIIEYMNVKIGTIESAIISVMRQIQLFHEYRTRLIADVVTGKLDVREAAAGLSEQGAPVADSCQDGETPAAPNQGCHP